MNDSHAPLLTTSGFVTAASPARSGDTAAFDHAMVRELERRGVTRYAAALPEESLVVDDRSAVSPAQMVETKLMALLQGSSLPVSHLQMRGLVRGRPGA